MKKMTFRLLPNYLRPVFKLNTFYNLEAMLDTGAVYPVWTRGETYIKKLGAVKIRDAIEFGGFGGMTQGVLYKIPYFRLGDLIFQDMGIIACSLNFPVPLILSATMFNNLIYEADIKNHRFSISVPNDESLKRSLNIKKINGHWYVMCTSAR